MHGNVFYVFIFICFSFSAASSQNTKTPACTDAAQRQQGYQLRKQAAQNSVASGIEFRSVGPTVMSGRVTSVAVSPKDPSQFYVAYASGGLWYTNNNGATFSPLFDHEAVMTLGDVAVNWTTEPPTIWLGTGENNSSRSSYSGLGMYVSTDGGKTWQNKGLPESHHIGRIVLHPTNPNVLWVAVLGHLYSANKERGVYKTTDGGNTWKQVLYIDDNTGAIDLTADPKNPDVLYAAAWHRQRRAWNFTEGGQTSGIYKSTDGGETWALVTGPKSNFPTGKLGRIGLDIHPSGTIYACIDNQNLRPKEEPDEEEQIKLTKDRLRTMSKDDFLKLEKWKITGYLQENGFPDTYDADKVLEMVKTDKIKPLALVEYLEDANQNLFETPVIGAEVYRSDNGGQTWEKTNKDFIDDLYYSYGYYFGQIRVSPQDVNKIYIMGVPILRSDDGGKTFTSISADNVHADHHALWVNPKRPGHLINGNDGGINISYDDGKNWFKCNTPPVGQFYAVNVDMEKPYNVYGGLQDNGVWTGSSSYKASVEWQQSGSYPYKELFSGDGMQVSIDGRNKNIVYTGSQFGVYYRIDRGTDDYTPITPQHELGERPYRFNWQTPILLSVHNQDILYFGTNKLLRSLDKGNNWTAISADLTKGGKPGNVPYGTITTISESKFKFGLIYTGTDDGLIHLTKDGGNTWTRVSDKLPQDLWVSRVVASVHNEARVYVSLNGYRWDNFLPYLYVSDNYGVTWNKIGNNLPNEPINVVREDPENPDILYVGTDNGLYVSLNRGQSFMQMNNQLPAVAVHDLVIHPRDKELVAGTHGRSIYICNVEHLQQLTPEILAKNLHVFEINDIKYNKNWGKSWSKWAEPRLPEINIPVYAQNADTLTITVFTQPKEEGKDSLLLTTLHLPVQSGMNYLKYNLTFDEKQADAYKTLLSEGKKPDEKPIFVKKAENGLYYLQPGTYTIRIAASKGKTEEKTALELKK